MRVSLPARRRRRTTSRVLRDRVVPHPRRQLPRQPQHRARRPHPRLQAGPRFLGRSGSIHPSFKLVTWPISSVALK